MCVVGNIFRWDIGTGKKAKQKAVDTNLLPVLNNASWCRKNDS